MHLSATRPGAPTKEPPPARLLVIDDEPLIHSLGRRPATSLFIVVCLTGFLSACNKPEAINNMPLAGHICLVRPGGQSIELSYAEVRVYERKAFDTVLQAAKTQAEERKQNLLDAALAERQSLEEEIRFSQAAKEHIQMAKETEEKAFSPYLGTYGDQIRKDMLTYSNQLAALETSIEQHQKALNDIANQKNDAELTMSRELLVRTVLDALPKPLQEIASDAHGNFRIFLKTENDYVVVTNASGDQAGDIAFYRTSIRPANRVAPSLVLLSL